MNSRALGGGAERIAQHRSLGKTSGAGRVSESNSPKMGAFGKNVTILGLPRMIPVLHIVYPLGRHAITCC